MIRYALFIILILNGCGKNDEPQRYEVQGEMKTCTVLKTQACGLTLACEGDGIFECVSN